MSDRFDRDGTRHTVRVIRHAPDLELAVDGQVLRVQALDGPGLDGRAVVTVDGVRHGLHAVVHGDTVFVRFGGRTHRLTRRDPALRSTSAAAASDAAVASMPGTVVSVACTPGDPVAAGQTLLVVESMKVRSGIPAPRAGTVAGVPVAAGQTFDRGQVLVALEPDADT